MNRLLGCLGLVVMFLSGSRTFAEAATTPEATLRNWAKSFGTSKVDEMVAY